MPAPDSLPGVQEPQQKILDIETAVQMLHVVLPEGNEHLEPFSRFLKEQSEYKFMNLDQWTSFYRFSQEVAFIHSFITCFSIRRSGALQQTFCGSPPPCPVLGFLPPCI